MILHPLLGFPGGSVVKNPPANAGDAGLIPGSGNAMDRPCWATVHGVSKSQTGMSDSAPTHTPSSRGCLQNEVK